MSETMKPFAFTAENRATADKIIAKYPEGRQQSAVMPLLDLAQRQNDGWVSTTAMDHIATILDIPPMRVYEVATFYTMYNKTPVGKFHIQTCMTTPCWLRGIDDINKAMTEHLGIGMHETTNDGVFTLTPVECLGACCNAPMVQINDDYYEDLTPENIVAVLRDLAEKGEAKTGSQAGRSSSEPAGKLTSLSKRAEAHYVTG